MKNESSKSSTATKRSILSWMSEPVVNGLPPKPKHMDGADVYR